MHWELLRREQPLLYKGQDNLYCPQSVPLFGGSAVYFHYNYTETIKLHRSVELTIDQFPTLYLKGQLMWALQARVMAGRKMPSSIHTVSFTTSRISLPLTSNIGSIVPKVSLNIGRTHVTSLVRIPPRQVAEHCRKMKIIPHAVKQVNFVHVFSTPGRQRES